MARNRRRKKNPLDVTEEAKAMIADATNSFNPIENVFQPIQDLEKDSTGVWRTYAKRMATVYDQGKIQLTDAIQKLIDWKLNVFGVKMDNNYSHLDIGSPQRYWEALKLSHSNF